MNLNKIFEMAAPFRNVMKPGFTVFIKTLNSVGGRIAEFERYVIGKVEGSDEDALYSEYDGRLWRVSLEDINNRLNSSYKTFTDAKNHLIEDLKKSGYVEYYKKSGDIAKYATGERKSGLVEPFSGTLYHGSDKIDLINLRLETGGFGGGSHLYSLNGKDAWSLTPYYDSVENHGNIIYELEADKLIIYYATVEEDDLDDIQYPDHVNAVAIPYGRYDEDEIAVVKLNGYDELDFTAVSMTSPIDGDYYRYEIDRYKVTKDGPLYEYILPHIVKRCDLNSEKVFGKIEDSFGPLKYVKESESPAKKIHGNPLASISFGNFILAVYIVTGKYVLFDVGEDFPDLIEGKTFSSFKDIYADLRSRGVLK